MSQKTAVIFKPRKFFGINTQMSAYSDFACDLMLERITNPVPPVLTLGALGYDTIRVSWTVPTTCVDGTILAAGAIAGYRVYHKVGSSPTTSDEYETVQSSFYIYNAPNRSHHYFGVTCVDNSGKESSISNIVNGQSTGYLTGADDPAPGDLTGSLYISETYIGYYSVSESAWTAYIENNGDFFLVGASSDYYFQWDHSTSSLTIAGTYKSALSGQRIQIESTETWGGAVVAYDSSEKGRAVVSDDGLEVYNTSGHVSTSNRVAYIPSSASTDAFFTHGNVKFGDTVIIGTTTDPSTSDKLYVSGDARFTGVLVTGDHGTESTAQVINVCYGTGSPPTASTTPIGTLFVQYSE